MIIVGSVRPGRIGLPIASWVRERAEQRGIEVDFADLAEIDLPLMNEAAHPRLGTYEHAHTKAWSERVRAADAFVFVTPEYNHSFSPALKNALDYLSAEWWRKPAGFVSYGGVSGGTRGVEALLGVVAGLGMVRTGANVELPFAAQHLRDGAFTGDEKAEAILGHVFDELAQLAEALRPLQNR